MLPRCRIKIILENSQLESYSWILEASENTKIFYRRWNYESERFASEGSGS
jgi:hypothetical protein